MKKTITRLPTSRDVAVLAGVALMSVSRVMNNDPSVRASTRKKVQNAIAQLGYRQNEAARLLRGERSKVIGLIVPDLSDTFFASCAYMVQHLARIHGYMTLIVSSERDAEIEIHQAELMANRQVSGLLVATSTHTEDGRLRALQATGLAVVAFDRPLTGTDTDCVLVENRSGAEEATQHLIKHGHRRIVCAGYDEHVYTIDERVKGFTHEMNSAGLRPQTAFGLDTLEHVNAWLGRLMAERNRPTAIFSLNQRASIFLLQAMAERNIKVPADMALVGFDDFNLATVVSPPLTTVAQSPVDLARRAMDLLLTRIRATPGTPLSSPAKILLPVKLMVRESCGAEATTLSRPHSDYFARALASLDGPQSRSSA